jgi:predicted MFS family arabinose efflux permease
MDRTTRGTGSPFRAVALGATALVSIAFFVDAAMWSVVVPLLPRYKSGFGLSTTQVGLVFAAYSAAMGIGAVPAGRLADRFGAQRWTAIGCLVMGGATIGLGLSHSFAALIAARAAQGVSGAIVWGAGPAWLAGITAGPARFRAMTVIQGAAALGLIAGPLVGGVGASAIGELATFTVAGALSGVLAVAVLRGRQTSVARYAVPPHPAPIWRRLGDRIIVCSIVLVAASSFVVGGLQVLAPLHMASLGVTQREIGIVYSIGAVLGAGMLFLLSRVHRSERRPQIAVAACSLAAIMTVALALPLSRRTFVEIVVVLVPLQSTLYALAYPMGTVGADRVGVGAGTVMGVMNLAWAAAAIVGPVGTSALQQLAGSATAYVSLGTVLLFTAIAARYLNRPEGLSAT